MSLLSQLKEGKGHLGQMKKIVVIGAGPAGLTAAYELSLTQAYDIVVLEETDTFGGISRTVEYKGNRMDMGGHRFFSKSREVNDWWEKMMPTAGQPAEDYVKLGKLCTVKEGGPNPSTVDRVMLVRNRLSRIFFNGKFFDYPISLKMATLKNMGFFTTLEVGFSYLKSLMFKRAENSLEDFYVNRFGKKLYAMFFESYTENLWGRHPRNISPEWGAQRVKGLSVVAILKNMLSRAFHVAAKEVETSLIEEFEYPKFGPGQLWEITAAEAQKNGVKIYRNAKAVNVIKDENNVATAVTYEKDGATKTLETDFVISSMPLKDLTLGINDVPPEITAIAAGLPYRDYITVGVLVKQILLKNETTIKTIGNILPDNWVYVHDKRVKMGRFQVYNNWSPYMVKDLEHTVWLGLEYFCNEGDAMWQESDAEFAAKAINEMVTMGLITVSSDVLDWHVERVKKAYPAYFDTYEHIDELRAYLDTIPNLFCVGRNGQHRYNNIDHSMCTAFETVKNIVGNVTDKSNIWGVNTEKEYHESKG